MAGERLFLVHIIPREIRKKGKNGKLLFSLNIKKAQKEAKKKNLEFLVCFQDEARFGRINTPQRCWAPSPFRSEAPKQIIREYTYAYGATFPQVGAHDSLILPAMDTPCMEHFAKEVSKRHPDSYILMILDGAACHTTKKISLPENIQLLTLPPYSPDFNPQENIWDEIREKFFKNKVFDSMDAVEDQLIIALNHLDNHPEIVKSISSWKWIMDAL